MTRADRYLALAVLRAALLAWAALGGLMLLFAALDEFADLGRRDYGLGALLAYVALTAPRRVHEVLPAGALIGSVLALGALAQAGELTALRAAGVSLRRMALAVLAAAVPLLLAGALLGEIVAPGLEAHGERIRAQAQGKAATAGTGGGFWHRYRGAYVRVARLEGTQRAAHIEAWEFGPRRELTRAIRAPRAEWDGRRWVLQDARLAEVTATGIRTGQVAAQPVAFLPAPGGMVIRHAEPERLSLPALLREADALERQGRAVGRYRLALWKKLTAPATTAVLVLLGLPLVLAAGRSMALGLYLVDQSFGYTAVAYGLPIALAAVLPTLLAGGAGVAALARAGRT
jgi:lipopolysaccharide export system permease protein